MKINLSNPQKMQILHGWGTSACWWSQYCSEPETQDKIVSLLYGSDGLGLNIYRYNIGGGTDEGNCRVQTLGAGAKVFCSMTGRRKNHLGIFRSIKMPLRL